MTARKREEWDKAFVLRAKWPDGDGRPRFRRRLVQLAMEGGYFFPALVA